MRTLRSLIRHLGVAAIFVAAAPAAAGLERGESAVVDAVVDGDTVTLADPVDGATEVRLVGIQAPKLPLGRPDFAPWPLAEEAKRTLGELARGRRLTLSFGGRRLDRHGRLLAHLHDPAGVWIQGEMLRRGLARVYTFADNRALAAEMLALEREARGRRRGIWGNPFYAVRTPEDAARHLDSFELVEGTVLAAASRKGRVYLNFGADWRQDFTVALDAAAVRLFQNEGLAPISLEGRRIRVRGWLRNFNGPLIEATHPEQIEVLAP